jgi:hypothetical protein
MQVAVEVEVQPNLPAGIVQIEVTQEDIDSGSCPITQALGRMFGTVRVTRTAYHTSRGCTRLPDEVRVWLRRYDAGRVVFPFTFKVSQVPTLNVTPNEPRVKKPAEKLSNLAVLFSMFGKAA